MDTPRGSGAPAGKRRGIKCVRGGQSLPEYALTVFLFSQWAWDGAGFTGSIAKTSGGTWRVMNSQSIAAGSVVPCSSSITVSP
jgi:hypothetical protein